MPSVNTAISFILVALVLAIGFVLGLFDLSFNHLIGYAVLIVAFTYVGVMLGRRSIKANEYADELYDRLKAAEAALKRAGLSIPFGRKGR